MSMYNVEFLDGPLAGKERVVASDSFCRCYSCPSFNCMDEFDPGDIKTIEYRYNGRVRRRGYLDLLFMSTVPIPNGLFDNKATCRREEYDKGVLVSWVSMAEICRAEHFNTRVQYDPWGKYPDIEEFERDWKSGALV